ncbi:MAG: UPF0149 family protein [Gammaproteobacteria bacterium]|nr:UPF0149 family protein [Gammaproteobacteria bacterium]
MSDPLSEEELRALDSFLLCEVDADEAMTIDMLDGYLHAIAIGPTTLHPQQWLPGVWGGSGAMPPMASLADMNRILGLILRHFNGIVDGLQAESPDFYPVWMTSRYRGRDYDEAEGWAYGFIAGMKLCWKDWQLLLDTPQGQAWFRPITLLGGEDLAADEQELVKTPARRARIALQIPESILAMHAYWMPMRIAIHERAMATTLQRRVGRNEPCPCKSGKKFKKCCGLPAQLH